jgi:hypothetical protein
MNPFHFVLPKVRMRDFLDNPFDYLLRASGMKTNIINPSATILKLDEDDDVPILPLMNDEEDNDDYDDFLSPESPFSVDENPEEKTNGSVAEQEALQAVDPDIPDADQLGIFL